MLIYYCIDMVMLSLMRGDYEIGIYWVVYILIEVFLFVLNIVVLMIMFLMVRLW